MMAIKFIVIVGSPCTIPAEMIGKTLITRYTPAETIAAAWIMAETGVGPSMASGNQTCSGNWADLPIVPIKRNIPITTAADTPKNGVPVLVSRCSVSSENMTS